LGPGEPLLEVVAGGELAHERDPHLAAREPLGRGGGGRGGGGRGRRGGAARGAAGRSPLGAPGEPDGGDQADEDAAEGAGVTPGHHVASGRAGAGERPTRMIGAAARYVYFPVLYSMICRRTIEP